MKDFEVVKWIFRHCGRRGGELAVLVLLNAWSGLCVTLFALLSKAVIDSAQQGDMKALVSNSAVFALLVISQMLARTVSSIVEAVSQGRAEMHLKSYVFSCVLLGEYASSAKRHSGDIMTRLTADVTLVSDSAVHLLPAGVAYAVRICSAAVALFLLDSRFAAVFIACGAFILAAAAVLRGPLKNLHRKVQESDSAVRSFMQEMTENLFAVKIFKIEDKVIERARSLQKHLYRSKVKRRSFSVFATIGFSLIFAAGFLAAVIYGADGILKGTVGFGTVTAMIQLVNQLQAPVAGFTGILPSFFSMTASAGRLIEMVSIPGESEQADISYDDFIEIDANNVTFGYDGETVISDSSFKVKKGEFIGIKGVSGAGKSTVFKLITGLFEPDSGTVTVRTEKGDVKSSRARNLFSFVPQGNMLFSGTVEENLRMLSPGASAEDIKRAVEDACAQFVFETEEGLSFKLGENGEGLSQGQAQRIAVARAMLGSGKILLMDEATSALDAKTEKKLLENLKSKQDITVLFITHRESVLEECDRVLTVSDGRIFM